MFGLLYRPIHKPLHHFPPDVASVLKALTFGSSEADISTLTTSRKCHVPDAEAGDVVTVTGGEYSLDGGAFTSDAGVWGTSTYMRVRATSSASYATTTTPTVTVGGVDYEWSLTTIAETILWLEDTDLWPEDTDLWLED